MDKDYFLLFNKLLDQSSLTRFVFLGSFEVRVYGRHMDSKLLIRQIDRGRKEYRCKDTQVACQK